MIRSDILHHIHLRSTNDIVLKLHMSKAFNGNEWPYIEFILNIFQYLASFTKLSF